ncbi:hypothetical protein PanWU01x14_311260 [Parasponia andersonii]|uniref:Uncharacterized protein n=1 Tax=Parasponia andersonii TaxID=3476 RepID=A0A2P5AQ30_PARAD|nr:hypothetical protein PanWU01x14_311260 [Parasponia andersonii]
MSQKNYAREAREAPMMNVFHLEDCPTKSFCRENELYTFTKEDTRPIDENLDSRVIYEEKKTGPMEELAKLPVDKCDKTKTLKIGKNLNDDSEESSKYSSKII